MHAADSHRKSRPARWLFPLLLVLCCLGSSGCVSSLVANKIIRAPNLQATPLPIKAFIDQLHLDRAGYSLVAKIPVVPHAADLSIAVLEPGDYHFEHELKLPKSPRNEDRGMSIRFAVKGLDQTAAPVTPKGTLVLLHGVMMTKESMLHWGFFLAQKGYRIVLVDLRGHGQSTGDTITYGALETGDLSQVLDELTRRQVIAGRIGVLGLSYGGAIAIQWAAREPRIDSVVALAPFSDARKAIDEFAHALIPEAVARLSPETISKAFALAARRGGFTWEQVDVLAAAHQLRQPVLLIHGRADDWIPSRHSEAIKAAAPAGSRLLLGPGNHLTISVRLDPIGDHVARWFDRGLVHR